jgi:hypothetical protein
MQRDPENLRYFNEEVRRLRVSDQADTRSFDGGDGGGYDGSMEKRLTALETQFATVIPTLATKLDIADLKGEVTKSSGEVKTDMATVRAEIAKSSGETHKWMIATVIGLFVGFGGLFMAMSNALKPSAPSRPVEQTPQPIVIYAQPAAAGPTAPTPSEPKAPKQN